nr:replication associated protein [Lake Sarah-associated circular virus-15]ALE29629.1 replication associated protein [Lake Sarah-associated circular virus-15]
MDPITDTTIKSTRWAFTAYEGQWHLFETMPPEIAEWGWQTEKCPDTDRLHYQGYLMLQRQQRLASLVRLLPGVHFGAARNWTDLVNYCRKKDTRVEGTEQVHRTNRIPTLFGYAQEVISRLPSWDEIRQDWITKMEHVSWMLKHGQPDLPDPVPRSSIFYVATSMEAHAYDLVTKLVGEDIQKGQIGVEFIVQNPLWITTFKNQIRNMVLRKDFQNPPAFRQTDRQTEITISFE